MTKPCRLRLELDLHLTAKVEQLEQRSMSKLLFVSLQPSIMPKRLNYVSPAKAIDRYIALRSEEGDEAKLDSRLVAIIEGIFKRCIEDGEHKQALGIALESHRLDVISHIFNLTNDTQLLSYVIDAALETSFTLSYRNQVLNFILPLFPPLSPRCTYIHDVTRILVTLSSASQTVPLLTALIPGQHLLAYQIAFDLAEGGAQDYLQGVRDQLPTSEVRAYPETVLFTLNAIQDDQPIYDKLRQILTGEESIKLYLDFLKRNNKVDMLILKGTKVREGFIDCVHH